jgi:hypothetical protein
MTEDAMTPTAEASRRVELSESLQNHLGAIVASVVEIQKCLARLDWGKLPSFAKRLEAFNESLEEVSELLDLARESDDFALPAGPEFLAARREEWKALQAEQIKTPTPF